MYSINFPKMFTSAKTLLVEDHDAILSNLKLLLASDRTVLFGDPYYGTELKKFIYEQNNSILKDLVIDEIYETIILFLPQIYLSRSDIDVTSDGVDLFATIRCTYYLDQKSDLYEINLTNVEET